MSIGSPRSFSVMRCFTWPPRTSTQIPTAGQRAERNQVGDPALDRRLRLFRSLGHSAFQGPGGGPFVAVAQDLDTSRVIEENPASALDLVAETDTHQGDDEVELTVGLVGVG